MYSVCAPGRTGLQVRYTPVTAGLQVCTPLGEPIGRYEDQFCLNRGEGTTQPLSLSPTVLQREERDWWIYSDYQYLSSISELFYHLWRYIAKTVANVFIMYLYKFRFELKVDFITFSVFSRILFFRLFFFLSFCARKSKKNVTFVMHNGNPTRYLIFQTF